MKKIKFFFILLTFSIPASSTLFAQIPPPYQNPHDDYGELHNSKLEDFYDKTFGAGNTTEENVESAFKSQRFSGFGSDSNIKKVVEGTMSANAYIDQTSASSDVKAKLKQILNYVDSHDNYKSLFIAMASFEQSVANDQRFNENEKKLILIGSSIAKYSHKYWHSNYSDWGVSQSVVKDIIKADFIGGIGRAIAVGLLTGGPAGAGTVAAYAFGASAATGLWHGLNWLYDKVGQNTGWW